VTTSRASSSASGATVGAVILAAATAGAASFTRSPVEASVASKLGEAEDELLVKMEELEQAEKASAS